jgi:hypothetical protein
MSERDRLDFVEKRDGYDAMLKFAEQTLAVYVVQSVKKGPYREAVEELVDMLEEAGKKVTFGHVEEI